MNDPFWRSVDELDALTDREVYEWLLAKYVKDDGGKRVEAWKRAVEAADAAFAEKALEQRKAEYMALCRDMGCSKEAALAEWQKYLDGEAP